MLTVASYMEKIAMVMSSGMKMTRMVGLYTTMTSEVMRSGMITIIMVILSITATQTVMSIGIYGHTQTARLEN